MWLPHADASSPRSFTFSRNVVLKRLKHVGNERELTGYGLHFPTNTSWLVPPNVRVVLVFIQRVFFAGRKSCISCPCRKNGRRCISTHSHIHIPSAVHLRDFIGCSIIIPSAPVQSRNAKCTQPELYCLLKAAAGCCHRLHRATYCSHARVLLSIRGFLNAFPLPELCKVISILSFTATTPALSALHWVRRRLVSLQGEYWLPGAQIPLPCTIMKTLFLGEIPFKIYWWRRFV